MPLTEAVFDVAETTRALRNYVDIQEYEAYLRKDLPRRVLIKLNQEFHIMAEHAKQRLLDIVRDESCMTLRSYMDQKGHSDGLLARQNDVVDDADISAGWDLSILDNASIFSDQLATSFLVPWEGQPELAASGESSNAMTYSTNPPQSDSAYGSVTKDGMDSVG